MAKANGDSPHANHSNIDAASPPDDPVHEFATLAVHAGAPIDPVTGAVIESICLSTTFAQSAPAEPIGLYEYTRSANPNRHNFEAAIAALEKAKYSLAFSSGSASTAVILQALAPPGSHIISVSDVYGGTHRYFTKVAAAYGVTVTFTPSVEADLESLIRPAAAAAAPVDDGDGPANDDSSVGRRGGSSGNSSSIPPSNGETRLIWIETPSNPTLKLTDISLIARSLSTYNTTHATSIKLVVDNTFLSPYLQNPLTHGADIVTHSVTKYINGHSDVLMGCLATNDPDLHSRLAFLQNAIGAVPSPFDCWLARRGLKTLHLRARAASENALAVAQFLESSPHILSVSYPGLPSHPQRSIALAQHRSGLGGGMLSFRFKNGGAETAARFAAATKIFTLAESLGGVESLVEVPARMTHAGIPRAQREEAGVWDDLVRLSCGVEDAGDLVADVRSGVEVAVAGLKGDDGHRGDGE